MHEQQIDLPTPDGQMPTFVVRPDDDASGGQHLPVVLFLMDAPGMREELRDMCRRLARHGYYVMAPQLYYREVRSYNLFETEDRDRMVELMTGLSNAMVMRDVGVLLAHAAEDPAADTERVGTVGYCMSGPFTIMAAAHYPDQIRAAASIHGVRLAVDADDSPHRHLARVTGEIYVACAETDSYAPPEMVAEFEHAMQAAGTDGRVEWYPGTEHGFAFSERPQYVELASEQHWDRLIDLFGRRLSRS